MIKQRFQYCLNAILYCLWRHEMDKNYLEEENLKNGGCIYWADRRFAFFYILYWAFLSFVIEGLALRMFENIDFETIAIPFLLPIVMGYLLEYRLIQKDDRYIGYFELFAHEDEMWHRKWKRRTVAFCIGGGFMFFLGIVLGWVIIGVRVKFPWMDSSFNLGFPE